LFFATGTQQPHAPCTFLCGDERQSLQASAEELAATNPKVDAARFAAYERAALLMRTLIASPTFPEFLTVPAYAEVLAGEKF
jgi:hypothetical protein